MLGSSLHAGPATSRAQVALEFVVVYSIILVIFVVAFAAIATQRAVVLSDQQSSIMQLLAQNVAGYINQALQAGSGYSMTVPLGAGIGQASYNISVSTDGEVLAKTGIGNEVITGTAFSSARRLFINGTLIANSNSVQLYKIPAYSGSIKISNLDGIIFVDQAPPSPSTLTGTPLVTEPASFNPAYFNGGNAIITVSNTPNLVIGNSITLDAWVDLTFINTSPSKPYVENPIIGELDSGSQPFMLSVTNNGIPVFLLNWGSTFQLQPSFGLSVGNWYDLAATYNKTAGKETLYINGNVVATASNSITLSGSSILNIGGSNTNGTHTKGYIADVQIYNASLSANQIGGIYSGGPLDAPPALLPSLVGWWPLNGNPNDYSGRGSNGVPGNVIFQHSVDLLVQVPTVGGARASGIPVGISTTNYLLGGSNTLAAYTNNNGLVSALLNSNGFAGNAIVQVETFNGNISTVKNVIGWWPLNLGASPYVGEYSASSKNGTFKNSNYGYLANRTETLVGVFNGLASFTTGSALKTNTFTLSFWVDASNQVKMTSTNGYTIFNSLGTGSVGFYLNNGLPANAAGGLGDEQLSLGSNLATYPGYGINGLNWSFVAVSVNNGLINFYTNGKVPYSTTGIAGPYTINNLTVGRSGNGISAFNGMLSNIQLYGSTLTQSQVTRIYTQGLTSAPLANENLIAWYPLTGSVNNYANINNLLPATSNLITYNSIGFTNPSAPQNATLVPIFNGIANVLFSSAPLPDKNLCYITVSAWAYDRGLPGNAFGGIFNFSSSGTDKISMNDNGIRFTVANSVTPNSWNVIPGYSLKGSWVFVATTLSNGLPAGYLNGLSVGTPPSNSIGCINIKNGIFGYSGSTYMNGSIVDIQAYNRTLSPFQIEQLYLQGIPSVTNLNTSFG